VLLCGVIPTLCDAILVLCDDIQLQCDAAPVLYAAGRVVRGDASALLSPSSGHSVVERTTHHRKIQGKHRKAKGSTTKQRAAISQYKKIPCLQVHGAVEIFVGVTIDDVG
jgi:hypothetical protein